MSINLKCERLDYVSKIKNELLVLRTGHLWDFTVITSDGASFKVHKVVLSMFVPYFTGLFQSNMIECKKNTATLDTITGDRFARILDYSYTGEVTVENINLLKDLYVDAKFFCLHDLAYLCSEDLVKHICDVNALDLLTFAEKNSAENLELDCFNYIEENSLPLFEGNQFLYLSVDQFKKILLRGKLMCSDEDTLDFALKWLNHDLLNRKCYLDFILSQIDILKISRNAITKKFLSSAILRENKSFIDKTLILLESCVSKTLPEFVSAALSDKIILCLSKYQIVQYECNSKGSKEISMKTRYNFFAATNYRNNIFISGGEKSDKCLWYSHMSSTFKNIPAMQENRWRHRAVACQDQIFCCGGENNYRTVEIFDLGQGIWLQGPRMQKCHYDFGLSVKDGILYATGGGGNIPKEGAFERLDPRENIWTSLSYYERQNESIYTKSLTKSNYLYDFSLGENGHIYDIRANKWLDKKIEIEPIAKQIFSVCALEDDIFMAKTTNNSTHSQTQLFKWDHVSKWGTTLCSFPYEVFEILPIIY